MFTRLFYRNFNFALRGERWFHRHTSRTGKLLFVLAVVAFLFGIDPRRTLSLQLFAICSAAIVVAIIACQRFKPAFSAIRQLPRYATVGQPFRYRLLLRNLGGKDQLGLQLRDEPAQPVPSLAEFIHCKEPHAHKRNWFDRKVGYPRWLYLNAMLRGADNAIAEDVDLPAHTDVQVAVELIPKRRGRLRLETTTLARPDPFGLFFAERRIINPDDIVVLPKRHPMAPIRIPGSAAGIARGEAAASKPGQAEAFVSLREYRPGDPPRHIHWKSWARLHEPVIKEFQDQHQPHYALVLDNFAPVAGDLKTEAAIEVAASMISPQGGRGGDIDRIVLTCDAEPALPKPAPEHLLLEKLAVVQHGDQIRARRIEKNIFRQAGTISGVVCVFCNLTEEYHRFVDTLINAGVPVLVAVIRENGDKEANAPGLAVHGILVGEEAAGLARLSASLYGS